MLFLPNDVEHCGINDSLIEHRQLNMVSIASFPIQPIPTYSKQCYPHCKWPKIFLVEVHFSSKNKDRRFSTRAKLSRSNLSQGIFVESGINVSYETNKQRTTPSMGEVTLQFEVSPFPITVFSFRHFYREYIFYHKSLLSKRSS